MRDDCVPGGSIGTPMKVTELPETDPWNTFGLSTQVGMVLPVIPNAGPATSGGAAPGEQATPVAGLKAALNSSGFAWNATSGLKPATTAGQRVVVVQVCVALVCAGVGSSIVRTASDWVPVSNRLVICVLRKIVMLACGIKLPTGVGVPPLQFRTMSPTSSVKPSERTVGGTPALAIHWTPFTVPCALAAGIRPNSRVTAANASTYLRKSAISFSL